MTQLMAPGRDRLVAQHAADSVALSPEASEALRAPAGTGTLLLESAFAWVLGLHLGETRCVVDVCSVSGNWGRLVAESRPGDRLVDLADRLAGGDILDGAGLGQLDLTGFVQKSEQVPFVPPAR